MMVNSISIATFSQHFHYFKTHSLRKKTNEGGRTCHLISSPTSPSAFAAFGSEE